jgi:hypothetical protein
MMDRAAFFALIPFLFFAVSCGTQEERALNSHPTADQGETKTSPFDGKWQVSSGSYQTSGPIYYTFRGDVLTIESRQREEKRLDAPQHVSITRWKIAIDDTKSPARLTMKKIDEPGAPNITRTEAFEFRNGDLWMCRDFGDPITSDSFRGGSGAWVTGLRRIR